jgi:hypothetical protein
MHVNATMLVTLIKEVKGGRGPRFIESIVSMTLIKEVKGG